MIADAIIHYNTLLVSRAYEQKAANGNFDAIKIFQGFFLFTWWNVLRNPMLDPIRHSPTTAKTSSKRYSPRHGTDRRDVTPMPFLAF